MTTLPPLPDPDDGAAVVAWVAQGLGHLVLEGADGVRPGVLPGGQRAADAALAGLDVSGYSRNRSTVYPVEGRGATRMSPYVRHGLVSLPAMWAAVTSADPRDRDRYRDELLWQEYARHLYARVGARMREPLRHNPSRGHVIDTDPWQSAMACVASTHGELVEDGWLVNQSRMWLASHWTVRHGRDWNEGEDEFFRHLLDGSRAANRLGWQWTVGAGTGRPTASAAGRSRSAHLDCARPAHCAAVARSRTGRTPQPAPGSRVPTWGPALLPPDLRRSRRPAGRRPCG